MTNKEALEKLSFYVSEELGKDNFIECYEIIEKDLTILNKIKESIWKSDDAYYIDMCITTNNENKDIYSWLEENNNDK